MNKNAAVDISNYSTFKLFSTANEVFTITTTEQLQKIIKRLVLENKKFIIIGRGSNSLFSKTVTSIVLVIAIADITYCQTSNKITVTAGAGVLWDDLVLSTVEKGYNGLEALSGIPGTVGAAPIQNIGAYGTELSEHIVAVTAYDIETDTFTTLTAQQCGFAYRTSNFKTLWIKKNTPRYIVTGITLRLSTGPCKEVQYPGVKVLLPENEAITAVLIRNAIIAIRWSKLPQPDILPNVGSFFHNPVISSEGAQALLRTFSTMPVFTASQDGMSKLSAGWLIEQCGWKGKRQGSVGMYEKNALVMVNYGNATLEEVLRLQAVIQDSIQEKFGISLIREPMIIS